MKTPYFIVREKLLSENINGFRQALDQFWPNSRIAYSVKTNSLPWVLSWMKDHGVDAEVVSDEEYELALLCGFPDRRIVFNGPVKGKEMLPRAVRSGAVANLDAAGDLTALSEEKPEITGRIGLRLNVNPDLFDPEDVGYQEDGFRFGFSEETGAVAAALKKLDGVMNTASVGLHLHVNSITRSPEVYKAAAEFAAGVVKSMA